MYLKFGVKVGCTSGGVKVIAQNTHPLRSKSTCLMSFDKEFLVKDEMNEKILLRCSKLLSLRKDC
jgi:hypothetical protein